MSEDLRLFDEPLGQPLPLSPGEQKRLETQRSEWRRRQRKCRGIRRFNARVDAARADGIEQENLEILAREEAYNQRIIDRADADDETLWPWIVANHRVWVAVLVGGPLATRVFELTDGAHFTPPFDLVFQAARQLHARGLPVTSKSVDKELKKQGVILMPTFLERLDKVLSSKTLSQHLTLDDVSIAVEHSKKRA